MSSHTAPDTPTHYSITHREALSKFAGAGAGSALVVWANAFGASPGVTRSLEIAAPSIAVIIATLGPYATRFLKHQTRYYGLHYLLTRAKKFAASTAEDSQSRTEANATVQKLELIINDLNNESAGFINSMWR